MAKCEFTVGLSIHSNDKDSEETVWKPEIPECSKRKIASETFNWEGEYDIKPKKRKVALSRKETKVVANVDEEIYIDQKVKVENVEKHLWAIHELLSEWHNINEDVAFHITKLFEEGNTIPFIARYRKDVSHNMSPEQLRDLKEAYNKILALKLRAQTVLKHVEKSGNLSPALNKCILSARSIEELEYIYAPYKPGGKGKLADRAKALGLEEPALFLLHNTGPIDLGVYLDKQNNELDSLDKVKKGIIHILAHIISTNLDVLTFIRKLQMEVNFTVEVKRSLKRSGSISKTKTKSDKLLDESKFENYFNFKIPVKYIKPHQVLAINRGESQKVLTVKINVPNYVSNNYSYFCANKFISSRCDIYRKQMLDEAIKDSYARLIQPLMVRKIRSELKTRAEKASLEVFSSNLKQLLLGAPVKGRSILGIDPGFLNGCKIALVSPSGCLMASNVVYPHRKHSSTDAVILRDLLKRYNCNLIALGNGTACRETEAWISNLIETGTFAPLEVTYTIVSENGASVYSCSPEAKKEFPVLDPNLISAVSLARRVQDPLAELVKVEPKHLGVGMYQHDLPKKHLEEALDEVVSECVSFVGVNLNTASQCVLRRIAGLSDKRAGNIINHREKNGLFRARKDLLSIKGIGKKVFQQCAGFLRVEPVSAEDAVNFYKSPDTNKLDCTIIHPEIYHVALNLINRFRLDNKLIGESSFIESFKCRVQSESLSDLSELLKTTEQALKLIIDTLSKPFDYDFRSETQQTPLFKSSLTTLADLRIGATLTGKISNVTHFGCFTDIGVGCDGLIHVSKMKGHYLEVGDRVEVTVINVEIDRKRIGLELKQTM